MSQTDAESKTQTFLRTAKEAGLTDHGASWAAKALYPPAALPNVGIPDDVQSAALLPEFRTERSIVNFHPSVVGPWDLCLIAHSGDACQYTYCVGPPGTDFSQAFGWDDTNTRHIYVPTNVGQAQVGQATLLPDLSPGAPLPVLTNGDKPRGYRITHSSMTLYMTASDLENGGTLTAGQFRPQALAMGMSYQPHSDADGVAIDKRINLPLTEQTIALNCPRYYTGAARDGVYMPKRLAIDDGFAEPYVNETELVSMRVAGLTAGSVYLEERYQLTERTWYSAVTNDSGGVIPGQFSSPVLQNASTRDSVGVVIIRGLHPNASLKLKGYLGLEVLPGSASSELGFLRVPAGYDPRAKEFYESYARTMSDAYRASDNFLGAIFNAARTFLPKIASWLIPGLRAGAQAALPVVGQTLMKQLDPPVRPSHTQRELPPPRRARSVSVASTARRPPSTSGRPRRNRRRSRRARVRIRA